MEGGSGLPMEESFGLDDFKALHQVHEDNLKIIRRLEKENKRLKKNVKKSKRSQKDDGSSNRKEKEKEEESEEEHEPDLSVPFTPIVQNQRYSKVDSNISNNSIPSNFVPNPQTNPMAQNSFMYPNFQNPMSSFINPYGQVQTNPMLYNNMNPMMMQNSFYPTFNTSYPSVSSNNNSLTSNVQQYTPSNRNSNTTSVLLGDKTLNVNITTAESKYEEAPKLKNLQDNGWYFKMFNYINNRRNLDKWSENELKTAIRKGLKKYQTNVDSGVVDNANQYLYLVAMGLGLNITHMGMDSLKYMKQKKDESLQEYNIRFLDVLNNYPIPMELACNYYLESIDKKVAQQVKLNTQSMMPNISIITQCAINTSNILGLEDANKSKDKKKHKKKDMSDDSDDEINVLDITKAKCFNCGGYGHLKKDCATPAKYKDNVENNNTNNNNDTQNSYGNRGYGGRGRGYNFRGRGYNFRGRGRGLNYNNNGSNYNNYNNNNSNNTSNNNSNERHSDGRMNRGTSQVTASNQT